jgi:hypothetical protein
MILSIDFEWSVDETGYELIPGGPVDGSVDPNEDLSGIELLSVIGGKPIREDRIRRRGGNLRIYRPFEGPDRMLFRNFASRAENPSGLLDFVRQFGPLTQEGNRDGEPTGIGLVAAACMAELLQVHSDNPGNRFSSYARNELYWSRMDVKLARNPMVGRPQFRFVPATFLHALWLELGQFLTSEAQLRSCKQCGVWFPTGPGTRRRADAKFCSDQHRISFNSLKRTTSEATDA